MTPQRLRCGLEHRDGGGRDATIGQRLIGVPDDHYPAMSQLRIQLHRDLPGQSGGREQHPGCMRPLPLHAVVLPVGLDHCAGWDKL
jgi:hypothetical protein